MRSYLSRQRGGCSIMRIGTTAARRYAFSLAIIYCLAFSLLLPIQAYAESNEYQVKVGFLLNFARFIEWPSKTFATPDAPIVLAILGENPFGNALDTVKDKIVTGRKISVIKANTLEEIKGCHILFISRSKQNELGNILNTLKGANILMVSDMPDFASRGGTIGFITENNKIRFEINLDASKRSKIVMGSQLLSLAKVVQESP